MLSRSTHKGLVVKLRTRWPWRALLVAAIASISTVAPVSPSFASAAAASSPVVATGTSISCSVNTGSLWCWGEGYGVAPVKVAGPGGSGFLTNVSAVSVGQDVCALSSGSAYCWGLGYPSLTQPPKNPILATGVTSIATSLTTSSACAVQSGALLCWGVRVVVSRHVHLRQRSRRMCDQVGLALLLGPNRLVELRCLAHATRRRRVLHIGERRVDWSGWCTSGHQVRSYVSLDWKRGQCGLGPWVPGHAGVPGCHVGLRHQGGRSVLLGG